jgi:hypothetical protein
MLKFWYGLFKSTVMKAINDTTYQPLIDLWTNIFKVVEDGFAQYEAYQATIKK